MVADAGSAGFVLAAAMAAVLYGASDFLSGLAARSASVRGTAVLVQASALLAFVLALPLASVRDWPSPHGFLWAVVGGASSAVASLVYFRGLAKGTMGMVALVVGVLTIVLPVAVGMAWGEHVSGLALAGIAGAIGSVVLASNVDFRRALPVGNGMLESLVSGVLFALMFVSLSRLASGLNVVTFVVFQAVNVAVTVLVGYGQVRGCAAGSSPADGDGDRGRVAGGAWEPVLLRSQPRGPVGGSVRDRGAVALRGDRVRAGNAAGAPQRAAEARKRPRAVLRVADFVGVTRASDRRASASCALAQRRAQHAGRTGRRRVSQ